MRRSLLLLTAFFALCAQATVLTVGGGAARGVSAALPSGGGSIAGLPFEDSFESGLTLWDGTAGVITTAGSVTFDGSAAAVVTHTAGVNNDSYAEYYFADHPGVDGDPVGTEDLWLEFAHRWDAGWSDGGSTAQHKILILNSVYEGGRRFQIVFNWYQPTDIFFFEFFEWTNSGSTFVGSTTANADVEVPRAIGEWHRWKFRFRQNSPGVSDGILQVWHWGEADSDYTQIVDRSNINYNNSTGYSPNRLILSHYQIGAANAVSGTRRWDWLYMATSEPNRTPDGGI